MTSSDLFGRDRLCDLTRYARLTGDVIAHEMAELEKQNNRAAGIYRRLYQDGAPGVLLADEVGKGKTYVALGVALALLANKPRSRVVVLTHSRHMAGEWSSRWEKQMQVNCCPLHGERFSEAGDWHPLRFASFNELRDAYSEREPPRIAIGSYETLKSIDKREEASYLHELLKWVNDCYGVYLSRADRRRSMRDIVPVFDFRRTLRRVSVSRAEAHRFLRECFDPDQKVWKIHDRRVRERVDEIVADHQREELDQQVDLLIIDEAHKLEGTGRQRVITRLLRKRFRKCLFVTATPFALSVAQFKQRLLEFGNATTSSKAFIDEIDKLPLAEFERAVRAGEDFQAKTSLELALRKYIVRDTWDHDKVRENKLWKAVAQENAIVPSFLLERIIDSVLSERGQTHIASRRESLCSSWAAAVESLEKSPIKSAANWSDLLRRVVAGPAGVARADPKMLEAVDNLTEIASRGEKIVVFTQRAATARMLQRLVSARLTGMAAEFTDRSEYWRRQTARLRKLLNLDARAARILAKIVAHSSDAPERWDRAAVLLWWNKHRTRAFPELEKSLLKLESALGKGRRLPLVARFDADSKAEESHPIEKFNLPGAPFVLIATPKGQEGIDLHRYCRRVVLYDLTWNPAHMEQRIGRVHRLGGSHSALEKIEVVYCYQEGTYEAQMAKRVQDRCKMLRVLLGAGQWLDQDKEISDVERYQMSFPA